MVRCDTTGQWNPDRITELKQGAQVFNHVYGTFTAGIKGRSRAGYLAKARRNGWQNKMLHQLQKTAAPEAELLGDLTPLLEQIGSPDGLAADSAPLASAKIKTAVELRSFLGEYHSRVLQPLELPAIQRAFFHAQRNELRELITFDQSLNSEPALKNFASASRAVGRIQLERLRPLHDQRLVKRYLAAVEDGSANGWHTTVYGVLLAIYSLPLRQGLIGYAQRTTRGFAQSAARSLKLSPAESESLDEDFSRSILAAVESLLASAIKA
jgi:urease accessory protein UreF